MEGSNSDISSLIVVTYNIQHGLGIDGQFDLKRTGHVLTALNPDVVLLQEVDCWRPQTRMSHQPAFLAKMLKMDYAYGAVKHYRPGSYGNAILSRYPIVNYKNHILPGEDQRCCLEAKIGTPLSNIKVFNLHLGLKSAERYRHLQDIILPRVTAVSSPVLLGGDFNARPESSEIGLVKACLQDSFQANSGECVYTFPSDQPRVRIDYVFLNNRCELKDCKIIAHNAASDHLPLVCEVIFKP